MEKSNLNVKELVVYELIEAGRITQLQIARSARWLGCHPKHEQMLRDKLSSTLRNVRQIVRDLRLKHDAKIISDTDGYWIPESPEEVQEYLLRLEATARSQAKAWMVTYQHMKKVFGVESPFFNQLIMEL